MELKVGSKLNGFTVTAIREEKQIDGRLVQMTHDISGAELIWVDNAEPNKTFGIAFKTLPENSTGVFHILEHSVLCGSEKFPVKEPFVDLLKSSMNTFLNAITFQDKTMYPVSSRNEKDFLNLTEVYLDAVFAPAILKNPNIFYQEGWHIEQGEDGKLNYKGVVFNEMKGAVSDIDTFLAEEMITMLYPDNCYGVNSGGEPANIPELTYEEFINTYKRFYHPSNSRVFLDGDVPLEKTLKLIDEYLSANGKLADLPSFELQKPVSCEKTVDFALDEAEDTKDKGRLVVSKIISDPDNLLKAFAAEVLLGALAGSNEAPLKKAVLDSGLAQDLSTEVDSQIPQAYAELHFKNVKDGCDDELWQLVKKTGAELIKNGLDKRDLIAVINREEFSFKSPQEPAGILRLIKSMITWLHGGDPMVLLAPDEIFAQLRANLDNGYYEKLLEEILSDDGLCVLHARASHTAAAEKDAIEEAKLAELAKVWTDADRAENKKLNDELIAWQQTPDSPEAKAKLPKLPISEVSEDPQWDETEIKTEGGVTVLYHPVPSHGIVNFNMYFSVADRSLDDLSALSTLSTLLGALPTENHSSADLARDIKTYLGALSFKLSTYTEFGNTRTTSPVLVVSASVLEKNLEIAEKLIAEILLTTKFDDKEKIKNLLVQMDMLARQSAVSMGHALARSSAMAGSSAAATANDAISGFTAMVKLHELVENFDEKYDKYVGTLKGAMLQVPCRARLIASVTATEYKPLTALFAALPEGSCEGTQAGYIGTLPDKMGTKIPALIGFSSQAAHLVNLGEEFDGSLFVASNILSYDFLWNMVRVQGGAYGTGFRADMAGFVSTYSFRDPTPARSIEINKQLGDYLRQLCDNKVDLDNFIIAAVSDSEPLLSPAQRGALADNQYFSGIDFEMFKMIRKEMLDTNYDKLRWCAQVADKMANSGRIAAVGQEGQLAEFEGMEIREL